MCELPLREVEWIRVPLMNLLLPPLHLVCIGLYGRQVLAILS